MDIRPRNAFPSLSPEQMLNANWLFIYLFLHVGCIEINDSSSKATILWFVGKYLILKTALLRHD